MLPISVSILGFTYICTPTISLSN